MPPSNEFERRRAMDFYGNETMARAETQRRIAELQREARMSFASSEPKCRDGQPWPQEFVTWMTSRARAGATFMARTPTNP
jgi:hypothetical protein